MNLNENKFFFNKIKILIKNKKFTIFFKKKCLSKPSLSFLPNPMKYFSQPKEKYFTQFKEIFFATLGGPFPKLLSASIQILF